MSEILKQMQSAYLMGDNAAIFNMLPDLMDSVGKTVVELSYQRGQRIYLIKDYWPKKENKSVKRVCTTHFISYLIYPENPVRILYNITADSSWHEIDNLYFNLKTAREALEKSKTHEKP
jgi:hypothetical protein